MDNATIERMVTDFVLSYQRHRRVETTWRVPTVGFATATDPLFARFKDIIRPTHATPRELLPGASSVIVYFVPFSKELQRDNFEMDYYCSRSWAVAYLETNRLIAELNGYVKHELESHGHRVTCPPPTHNFDRRSLMSDWSHRHVAYAAGVGRFGVHNLIITEKGCNGRLGSVVTDLVLEASSHLDGEFCLQRAGIDCLKCVERCQYGALCADSFDRDACYRQCLVNDQYHQNLDLTDVCGKCSVKVPCSVSNPMRRKPGRGGKVASS